MILNVETMKAAVEHYLNSERFGSEALKVVSLKMSPATASVVVQGKPTAADKAAVVLGRENAATAKHSEQA